MGVGECIEGPLAPREVGTCSVEHQVEGRPRVKCSGYLQGQTGGQDTGRGRPGVLDTGRGRPGGLDTCRSRQGGWLLAGASLQGVLDTCRGGQGGWILAGSAAQR